MITFSIIIPFYNNEAQVKRCLRSIINYFKIKNTKFEIILVDDNSLYFHSNQILRFIQKYKDYKINIIRNKKNFGPAQSRNIGASKAKFEYLFFLDSDTIFHKDLSKIITKNLKNNNVIVGHYDIKPINNSISANFKAIYNFFHFSRKGNAKYETFNSACAIIKKKIFLSLKGFKKSIKWGMDYENEELGRRIIKKHSILLIPSLTVRHEFPNFLKMLKLYFIRAIPYVGIILKDKKFENTGPGFSGIIHSILYSILTTLSLISYIFFYKNFFLIIAVFFFTLFLITNLKFILFSIKTKPSLAIFFVFIKFLLSHILFLGSGIGLIKFIFTK